MCLGLSIIYFKGSHVTFPNRDVRVLLHFLNKFRKLRSTFNKKFKMTFFAAKGVRKIFSFMYRLL